MARVAFLGGVLAVADAAAVTSSSFGSLGPGGGASCKSAGCNGKVVGGVGMANGIKVEVLGEASSEALGDS